MATNNDWVPQGATEWTPEGATLNSNQQKTGFLGNLLGGIMGGNKVAGNAIVNTIAPRVSNTVENLGGAAADTGASALDIGKGVIGGQKTGPDLMQRQTDFLNHMKNLGFNVETDANGNLSMSALPTDNPNMIKTTAETAGEAASLSGLPGATTSVEKAAGTVVSKGAKIADFISQIIKSPSYSKVNKLIEGAADDATQAGKTLNWDEITQDARKLLPKNMSITQKQAFDKVIGQYTPELDIPHGGGTTGPVAASNSGEGIIKGTGNEGKMVRDMRMKLSTPGALKDVPGTGEGGTPEFATPNAGTTGEVPMGSSSLPRGAASPSYDPNSALALRRDITETYGSKNLFQNFLQSLMGNTGTNTSGSAETTAAKALRNALSNKLKEVAPDIQNPDQLYSFYKKIKGDIPTWGKRIAGGMIADKVLGNKFKGSGEAIIDALGTIIGNSL